MLRPDFSLIRPFTMDDAAGFRPVCVMHFSNADKNLYYINARHVVGTRNPTCRTIRRAIDLYKPQTIVIEESFGPNAVSPTDYLDYAYAQKKTNFEQANEAVFMAYLADAKRIPFAGGELPQAEIYRRLLDSGFETEDYLGACMLRHIASIKQVGLWDKVASVDYIRASLATFAREADIAQPFGTAEMISWYARHHRGDESFMGAVNRDVAPIYSANPTYVQKIVQKIDDIREPHIVGVITDALNKYSNVLAVYGDGHLVKSRAVFEAMLGTGRPTQLVPCKSPPRRTRPRKPPAPV